MTDEPLCRLDHIADGHSIGLTAEVNGERTALALIRQGNEIYAYINLCPHIVAPLDFTPGQFLNLEGDLIQCAMHGALFRIHDGKCVHGPCVGKGLTPVAIQVRGDNIYLA